MFHVKQLCTLRLTLTTVRPGQVGRLLHNSGAVIVAGARGWRTIYSEIHCISKLSQSIANCVVSQCCRSNHRMRYALACLACCWETVYFCQNVNKLFLWSLRTYFCCNKCDLSRRNMVNSIGTSAKQKMIKLQCIDSFMCMCCREGKCKKKVDEPNKVREVNWTRQYPKNKNKK